MLAVLQHFLIGWLHRLLQWQHPYSWPGAVEVLYISVCVNLWQKVIEVNSFIFYFYRNFHHLCCCVNFYSSFCETMGSWNQRKNVGRNTMVLQMTLVSYISYQCFFLTYLINTIVSFTWQGSKKLHEIFNTERTEFCYCLYIFG